MARQALHAGSFAGPRAFARHMLRVGLPVIPLGVRVAPVGQSGGGRAMEAVLFREGPWQIEFIMLPPDLQVPRHRHLRCASADLALGGSGLVVVNGRTVISDSVHTLQRGKPESNLLRIERGEWHHGDSGAQGGAYLSFQHWSGEPGFIADDWEAANG